MHKLKLSLLERHQSLFDKLHSLHSEQQEKIATSNEKAQLNQNQLFNNSQSNLQQQIDDKFTQIHKRELDHLNHLQQTLRDSLVHQEKSLETSFDKLSKTTAQALDKISSQVETRLSEGLEKTNQTFTDIVKRLALIDDAQRQLSELSTNVIGLQEILIDKRARGAFGEVQLKNLIENILPKEFVEFQSTLSNGTRVDCLLKLPPPNGMIGIDSKFPLENYQRFNSFDVSEVEKKQALTQFKSDIKKHINDIANKYIIPGETSNCAIMFIPAESIFAQIHASHPDLVLLAQQKHVWITSPTTMMAVLTTANTVIKDSLTQKHIQVIQEHIHILAKDFTRFESRMDKLSQHIQQAQNDVSQAHTSAKKIASRFYKIEQARVPSAEEQLETL
ncbi:MAG: DNA recombination protein RmuC [Francisellaceae bacterium]|nr:DNA recombination protein RmuC [Francisellaceae bacterium]MBT6206390.1 DNA recombination protein RmuC [Francisellaceae bacterium]MBT6538353.1 DNA recombination protein RmuC [Francisellaceae bacterium]